MVTCPQCGLVQPDGAAFCDECGAPLSSVAPASGAPPVAYVPPPSQGYAGATVMASSCPTCGKPIVPGMQFCDNCGASLSAGAGQGAGFPAANAGFPAAGAGPYAAGGAAPAGGPAVCASCGAQLEPGSAFCDMCGARVGSAAAPPMAGETQVQPAASLDPFAEPAADWASGSGAASGWDAGGGQAYGTPTTMAGQGADVYGGGPAYGSQGAGTPYPPQPVDPSTYPGGGPVDYGAPGYGAAAPAGYDQGLGACPEGRFVLQSNNATVIFPPGKPKLLVGREDPVSGVFPDIDMTNYGGDEGGVSRSHAQIYMQGGQLVLEDLQSVNFTFVNKEKLTPYQPYPLNDGDTVRFGRVKLNYYK